MHWFSIEKEKARIAHPTEQPGYFSVMFYQDYNKGECLVMTPISLKEALRKKIFEARKQVSAIVLLQMQGIVRNKPGKNFSVCDVQRISRCFVTGQEDRYKDKKK